MIFLFVTLFVLSLSVLLFELTLTRIFSIVLWYDYAFMAISVAFFGLGIGALLIHILKDRIREDKLPSKILQSIILFAVSLPIFLFVIGHVIPSNTSYIYLFYLASSIPFFFAGISMALIYLTMPKEISKLYFVDLVGAATATLMLDPLIRILGAESALISIDLLVIGPSLIATLIFIPSQHKKDPSIHLVIENKTMSYAFIVFVVSAIFLATNAGSTILAIQPGEIKGLHYQLTNPSIFKHLLTQWNSFSRIDVTRQMNYHNNGSADSTGRSKTLAQIAIDADADTPVFKWNGSISDLQWLKNFMDYMPYEISNANNSTLVIGSGGGEDVLVALAGGSKNVTAVELNPLIVSAAKQFGGSSAGNLYDRKYVRLFIDDGRRFISSTNSKYDKIVIKLVDSWAAQLAGGYALSENYLYTVEAFKQYLQHLNGDNGMLVMVRWNIELPRLIPLVVESLRQEETAALKRSIQDISKQILVVEDNPGLFFGSNAQRTVYPVLVIVKNSPFTSSELELAKQRIVRDNAKVIIMPGEYVQPPYDNLLSTDINGRNNINDIQKRPISQVNYDPQQEGTIFGLRPPTDDSPFYFAKEQIPNQMKLLLETVVGVSVVLSLLLIYYSRIRRIQLTTSTIRKFHILFVVLIGFGFIFLEITFIQKFLLLLGTPIMALTVILFSILLSSGIGAYLSGRLFNKNPYKAVLISIPILAAIVLIYSNFLSAIIDRSIILELYQRITLTVVLLSPVGLLMGFQFPSITRMASSSYISLTMHLSQRHDRSSAAAATPTATAKDDITLLWGINVIASVVGTVLAAISSMVIGFNGNLLIGLGLYLGALTSAISAARFANNTKSNQDVRT
jgi:hypothetical protein